MPHVGKIRYILYWDVIIYIGRIQTVCFLNFRHSPSQPFRWAVVDKLLVGNRWGFHPYTCFLLCNGLWCEMVWWLKMISCKGVLRFRLPVRAPSTRRRIQIYIHRCFPVQSDESKSLSRGDDMKWIYGWRSDRCWQCNYCTVYNIVYLKNFLYI